MLEAPCCVNHLCHAIGHLGNIGDIQSIPSIKHHANHPSPDVRGVVLNGLYVLGAKLEEIMELVQKEERDISILASIELFHAVEEGYSVQSYFNKMMNSQKTEGEAVSIVRSMLTNSNPAVQAQMIEYGNAQNILIQLREKILQKRRSYN